MLHASPVVPLRPFTEVAVLHFFNLYRFAVKHPLRRVGLRTRNDGVLRLGDWGWFFRRENEHLITLTKFQLFLLAYFANGWNTRIVQLFDFCPLFLLIPILCGVKLPARGAWFRNRGNLLLRVHARPHRVGKPLDEQPIVSALMFCSTRRFGVAPDGTRQSVGGGRRRGGDQPVGGIVVRQRREARVAVCVVYFLKRGLRAQSVVALALSLAILPLFHYLSGGVGSAGMGARLFTLALALPFRPIRLRLRPGVGRGDLAVHLLAGAAAIRLARLSALGTPAAFSTQALARFGVPRRDSSGARADFARAMPDAGRGKRIALLRVRHAAAGTHRAAVEQSAGR